MVGFQRDEARPTTAAKRPFQELPRLHVPTHALAQQAQPRWKTASAPVIMPSTSFSMLHGGSPPPPPPAAPRFQFFTSTVGGWFGRSSAPAKTLPSFSEILARTNQLQIVGQDGDEASGVSEHSAQDVDMLGAQQYQHQQLQMQLEQQHHELLIQQQHQQQAMAFVPSAAPPSYTAFAPQPIEMQQLVNNGNNNNVNMTNEMGRPSLNVVGAMEAQSPISLPSPMSSQTGDASKRRERWTEDEHARFMEGLNRYGRKWKKIQTFVQTKTAVQVRTHAYGYFAKLLRNMPEDDGVWELAEEMSSLPGAVLKGPGNGKRRNEPKTDEEGMSVLRRFVFSKKKSDDKKAADQASDAAVDGEAPSNLANQQQSKEELEQQQYSNWSVVEDSAASSAMLELKRQRIM